MVFGINKDIIKTIFSPKLLYAQYKKYKILRQHKGKNLKIDLYASIDNSNLGNHVFFGGSVKFSNSKINDYSYINSNTKVESTIIGKFCSIGSDVILNLASHPTDLISTHPTFYSNNKKFTTFSKKNKFEEYKVINIGNDVWIGSSSIIMGGVSIGDGAIIAAGSIVTKDVKPYEVVGGVPAKHIKFRLKNEQIKYLEKIKWWDKDEKWFKENYELFLDNKKFIAYFKN